jgi:hypothetical protein
MQEKTQREKLKVWMESIKKFDWIAAGFAGYDGGHLLVTSQEGI